MEVCRRHANCEKCGKVEAIANYLRPIYLTPTLSKIAEDYIVHAHVKPAVVEPIGKDQYGCIPHSSTFHALIDLSGNYVTTNAVFNLGPP